jgi:hypothetical protein
MHMMAVQRGALQPTLVLWLAGIPVGDFLFVWIYLTSILAPFALLVAVLAGLAASLLAGSRQGKVLRPRWRLGLATGAAVLVVYAMATGCFILAGG